MKEIKESVINTVLECVEIEAEYIWNDIVCEVNSENSEAMFALLMRRLAAEAFKSILGYYELPEDRPDEEIDAISDEAERLSELIKEATRLI